VDWIQWAKEAGAYVSPLLMAALIWMNVDRNRLIKENNEKDQRLEILAERVITVATQLQMFLFNERKA